MPFPNPFRRTPHPSEQETRRREAEEARRRDAQRRQRWRNEALDRELNDNDNGLGPLDPLDDPF